MMLVICSFRVYLDPCLCSMQRENFRCSANSMGVQTQLGTLSQIIKAIDPKLHQHLGMHSCWYYFVAIFSEVMSCLAVPSEIFWGIFLIWHPEPIYDVDHRYRLIWFCCLWYHKEYILVINKTANV